MNTNQAITRLRDVLCRQHKALATEDSYVFWLRRYILALRHMPSTLPSKTKLEQFLTDLATKRDLSASSQNQAFNALLFLYRDILKQQLGPVDALRARRPAHNRNRQQR